MKRRLFKLALFLIFGAIVNVAVAWRCALFAKTPPSYDKTAHNSEITLPDLNRWTENRQSGWPKRPTSKNEIGSSGRRVIYLSREANPLHATTFDIWQVKSGWPIHAMKGIGRRTWHFPTSNTVIESSGRSAILALENDIPLLRITEAKILPLEPVWPGFAINTIFYAVIIWLLTLGPYTARRMIRSKRGHCTKCGYDLRGDFESGCAECGWNRE